MNQALVHTRAVTLLPRTAIYHRNQLRHTCFSFKRPRQSLFSTVVQAKRGFAELLSIRQTDKIVDGRTLLKPQIVTPRLEVPAHIQLPPYVISGQNPWKEEIQVHNEEGIAKMRAAGKLAAEVLEMAGKMAQPGVATDEIDKAVHQMIIDNGAYPSPLQYGGFPKSVCTSVNECVCHGIPDMRKLQDGDIINIDVTVYLNGHHGDTSRMFYVGNVSDKAKDLCETTLACLEAAIKQCGPGVPVKEIGRVIHTMAEKAKYGVIKDFVGHGVGWDFHSLPIVQHCRNSEPGVLVEGQTFTIEPMLTEGTTRVKTWKDDWTVVTADGKLSAQFEHTLLITKSGHEVLTAWPENR